MHRKCLVNHVPNYVKKFLSPIRVPRSSICKLNMRELYRCCKLDSLVDRWVKRWAEFCTVVTSITSERQKAKRVEVIVHVTDRKLVRVFSHLWSFHILRFCNARKSMWHHQNAKFVSVLLPLLWLELEIVTDFITSLPFQLFGKYAFVWDWRFQTKLQFLEKMVRSSVKSDTQNCT